MRSIVPPSLFMCFSLMFMGSQRAVVKLRSVVRFVSWEIRVSLRPSGRGPIGQRRWLRQRPATAEPLHEVRAADEGSPKGDQVGVPLGNRLLSRLLGVAAVADERAVEDLAELGQGH